jgi:hypothetical protein
LGASKRSGCRRATLCEAQCRFRSQTNRSPAVPDVTLRPHRAVDPAAMAKPRELLADSIRGAQSSSRYSGTRRF